jgi:PAS domain S-box-containing protein
MAASLRLLLIEDSDDDELLLLRELRRGGWDVTHERVQTAAAMIAALERAPWDILISDYSMPQFNGLEAVAIAREKAPELPFLLISGTVGEEVAVEAMKAGANDYLFKGNLKRLHPAVQRELREAQRRRDARRLSEELARRDRQLVEAQRMARLGSWHIDVRANSVTLSSESLQIFGRPAETLSMAFGEFLESAHPEDRTLLTEALRDPDATSISRDMRVVQAGGAVRFVHLRGGVRRDAEGWPVEASGMIQDITERKEAERALQQAHDELAVAKETAEAANRAKDHFLAILSHELRTPLTPVLALVSELEGKPDVPAELRRDLAMIRRNVSMEARLIDDLLDLTRIARNKVELHLEVVDAHHSLECALQLFQKDIGAGGVAVEADLQAAHHHVWADSVRLEQVFMNLLSNALKFTAAPPAPAEPGRIILRSRNDDQSRLQIQLIDNGIGIEPELLPRLFNSFEQGERSVTRHFGGLGLGLSIARALLESHNGRISLSSEGRGKGTTVTIDLPTVAVPEQKAAASPSPPSAPGDAKARPLRVLLVEDHEDTRRVMTRLLRASACTVAGASSVKEALTLAERERFELLVSDIGLPDGTGLEVMKNIRARYPIRGIAVSGFGQAEDIERSREAGFDVHLTKPIDFPALTRALDAVRT